MKSTNIIRVAVGLMAVAAIASCQKTEPGGVEPIYGLNIATSIDEQTFGSDEAASKVTIDKTQLTTTFDKQDNMGLYLAEWSMNNSAATSLIASGNQTDNEKYTLSDASKWEGKLTNPLTWRKVSAFAYHPYVDPVNNALALTFTPRTDQSTGITSADYLMWGVGTTNAAGYTPAKGAEITLKFTHKLTRLVANVTLPSAYNGSTITGFKGVYSIACPVDGTLNIADGTFTPSTTLGEVKMARTDGGAGLVGTFDAMVIARAIPQYTQVMRVEYTGTPADGSLYYYAATGGLNLLQGQIHTITLSTTEFGFAPEQSAAFTAAEEVQEYQVVSSSNVAWTLGNNSNVWLTMSLSKTGTFTASLPAQTGTKTIFVKAAANATGQPRLGSLKLTGSGFTDRELLLRQN